MATPKTLFSFSSSDGHGTRPTGGLILDQTGDLFGTTDFGGANNDGTAFEIIATAGTFALTPTTLVSFGPTASPQLFPSTGLVADKAGNLFGTVLPNATLDSQTVFEIPFTSGSYASTPTNLATFAGADSATPNANLIIDGAGDLFGTTRVGGANNAGTVFELPLVGGAYPTTPTTLVTFNGTNARLPESGLLMDAAGDLFGTTLAGGTSSDGTVYEVPFANGNYATTPTILVNFNSTNGADPTGNLIMDAAGNLFGTAQEGGGSGFGTVFELPFSNGSYATSPTTLVSFDTTTGIFPIGGVIMDAAGNLFGTTESSGANSGGSVYEVPFVNGTYASTPTLLLSLGTSTGTRPFDGVVADAAGDLFTTTEFGGTNFLGTVLELTDTGFVVSCYRGGTRIATPDGERAVESLAEGDLVLTLSGEAHPIAWIGRRRIDCRRHPKPESVWPVRVLAGAFGDALPHRDLWLSPDHAVFVDNVLIPIKYLINGISIRQVPESDVTYYHIELPRHDVLLADGLPAESWLDVGDRCNFDDGGRPVSLHPEFSAVGWEAMGCAPMILTGPILEAVRRRVIARLDRHELKAVIQQRAA